MKLKDSIILILAVIIAIAVGVFAGYKLSESRNNKLEQNNNQVENNENNKEPDKKENLTKEELEYLREYINKKEINPFVHMRYDNSNEILVDSDEPFSNAFIMTYAVSAADFAKDATTEQYDVIVGDRVWAGSLKLVSMEDLSKFINETTNLTPSEDTLKQLFSYNNEVNAFIFGKSDTLYFPYKIKSSYKIDNRYYLTLKHDSTFQGSKEETEIELILIKENDKYYFYSCKHN